MTTETEVRTIDYKNRMRWFDTQCLRCHSKNITPAGKHVRQGVDFNVAEESWCHYVCEECGLEFGPVKYAEKIRLEAVRGITGRCHASDGSWKKGEDSKLATVCGKGVSPNNRVVDLERIDCTRCLERITR